MLLSLLAGHRAAPVLAATDETSVGRVVDAHVDLQADRAAAPRRPPGTASQRCAFESAAQESEPLVPPRQKPADLQDERLLQLVHVGKTGGSTVRYFLRQNAIDFFDYHMAEPVDTVHADFYEQWVVVARDPVDRAISAFNWRHPCGGGGASVMRGDREAEDFESRLFGCFAHEFAGTLGSASECGALAREALVPRSGSGHLGKGLQYYLGAVIHLLEKASKRVYLIRTESLQEDVVGLGSALLGLPPGALNTSLVRKKDAYPRRNDTLLTDLGRLLLTRALQREYELLAALEALAINGRTRARD